MKKVIIGIFATAAVFSTQILAAHIMTQAPEESFQNELAIDDFLEIDITTLPKLVQEAVQKEHEGATISKAFVNQDGTYKLVLDKDETSTVVYANAKGEWLKMED